MPDWLWISLLVVFVGLVGAALFGPDLVRWLPHRRELPDAVPCDCDRCFLAREAGRARPDDAEPLFLNNPSKSKHRKGSPSD